MKQQFHKVGEFRLKLSSIKRYRDYSKTEIAVSFSPTVNVYETETIKFKTEKAKSDCLEKLDLITEHDFITIRESRIRLSTIKKYKPINGIKLSLYFSTSKSKVVAEVVEFKNKAKREEILLLLDVKFGCD